MSCKIRLNFYYYYLSLLFSSFITSLNIFWKFCIQWTSQSRLEWYGNDEEYRKSFSWDYSLTSLSQVGFSVITCHRLDRPTGVRGVSGMGSVTSSHLRTNILSTGKNVSVRIYSVQKLFSPVGPSSAPSGFIPEITKNPSICI